MNFINFCHVAFCLIEHATPLHASDCYNLYVRKMS